MADIVRQPLTRETNGAINGAHPAAKTEVSGTEREPLPKKGGRKGAHFAGGRRPDGMPWGRPFGKGNPGRPPNVLNRPTREMRDLARQCLEDPVYQKNLKRRLREGSAGPIETLLYHYAYGKPVDRIKITGALGHVDMMGALQAAWGQLRSADPRALSGSLPALTNGGADLT